MEKCKDLSQEELRKISIDIADAFLAEEGCFASLTKEDAYNLFTIVVTACFEADSLYTSSLNKEGYCVYWTKAKRPGVFVQLKMLIKMFKVLPLKVLLEINKSHSDWLDLEKRYKKYDNYVEIFLLAVKKEYQGRGHASKMLKEVFEIAKDLNTICVLETDANAKVLKYQYVGMKVIDQRIQKSGVTMYALEK